MADIKNVEIMSLGTWNGFKITEEVFDDVIKAFEETKGFAKPVLKLGHNDEQKMLADDGLPAAGWVTRVYKQGKKLLADFSDIPAKIFELIKRKAYRKVSVELFSGLKFEGKEYPHLLGAVALLGSDLPAMANLNDILEAHGVSGNMFTFTENADTIQRKIIFENGVEAVSDKTLDNTNEIAELKKQLAVATGQLNEFKTKADELNKYREETDKKLKDLEEQKNKTMVANFCLDLQKQELLSPSMEPYAKALLAAHVDQKKFSVGEKQLDAKGLLEEMLKLAKQVFSINTKDRTTDEQPKEGSKTDELEEKINKYMDEHKVNFSKAYREVMNQPKK